MAIAQVRNGEGLNQVRKKKGITALTFQYNAPKANPITREKNAGNATAAHCRLESSMEFEAFPVI